MISVAYRRVIYCLAPLVFAGCMTPTPIGPRIAVMPAPGKPFDLFAADEHLCRQYADWSIGATNAAGSGASQPIYDSREAQWRYDNAYKQCMYAKGNQVPGYQPQPITAPPPSSGNRQAAPFPPPPPQP